MKNTEGATLTELVLVIAIVGMLIGFASINLFGARSSSSINASVEILISDLRQQQIKAVVGDTEGRGTRDDYGIYFESNRYILFHGSQYQPNDPTNFVVPLDDDLSFSKISVPSSRVVFSKGKGEVDGYNPASDSVTIHSASGGQEKTIQFNKYGAIISVQ